MGIEPHSSGCVEVGSMCAVKSLRGVTPACTHCDWPRVHKVLHWVEADVPCHMGVATLRHIRVCHNLPLVFSEKKRGVGRQCHGVEELVCHPYEAARWKQRRARHAMPRRPQSVRDGVVEAARTRAVV